MVSHVSHIDVYYAEDIDTQWRCDDVLGKNLSTLKLSSNRL